MPSLLPSLPPRSPLQNDDDGVRQPLPSLIAEPGSSSLEAPLLTLTSSSEMNDVDGNDDEGERLLTTANDEDWSSTRSRSNTMMTEEDGGERQQQQQQSSLVLKDVCLEIPKGKLTIIYGSTGGGKTSLLMALLGEIITVHGELRDKMYAYHCKVNQS